jgi:hypothetical protein
MVVGITHYLKSCTLLFDVDENKVFALPSNISYSPCNRSLLLKKLALQANRVIFFDELINSDGNMKFMGIGMCLWVLLELSYHL